MVKAARLIASLLFLAGTLPGPAEPRFPNPLSDWDMADPSVLRQGDILYLFCTGLTRGGGAYPIWTSPADERTSWTRIGSVLRPGHFPPWAGGAKHFSFWAPEVHEINGRFICYFCARDKDNRFCIGAATAPHPSGPFEPLEQPLVCSPQVGLIDAAFFKDPVSGRSFLLWKEDRNDLQPQEPTPLLIQELEPEGLAVRGEAKVLLVNDKPWEGVLVEAPTLIYRDGYYYLFFSGNVFVDDQYGVGVARSKEVMGPYEKYEGNPILKSDERFSGPGHQFLFEESPGKWTMFYHARDKKRTVRPTMRLLMSDPVRWNADGWPAIHDGTPSTGWGEKGKKEDVPTSVSLHGGQ